MFRHLAPLAALALALPACNPGHAAGETSGPMITTVSTSAGTSDTTSNGSSSSSSIGSSEGHSGSTTTPPPPDMPSFETEGAVGCTKLDFLFVLYNGPLDSLDAVDEFQAQTFEAIKGFSSELEKVADFDIHALVIRSDPRVAPTAVLQCSDECMFDGGCKAIPDLPCEMFSDQDLFDACDDALGSGVLFPIGYGASNKRCELASGRRYIDETEPDFDTAFDCIARVGNSGEPDLRPAQGMVAALGPQLGGAGGCNEGFLRDDALLVVVLFHLVDDDDSLGVPAGWAASLVAAKKGDPAAVVMVGILNDAHHDANICGAGGSVRLESVVTSFPYHVLGSICAPSFVPYFSAGLDLVLEACDHYAIPQ